MVRGILEPADLTPLAVTAEDGVRAQQKLYELSSQRTPRAGLGRQPVVLTEVELNAFLGRHLAEAADLPLAGVTVRLAHDGVVDLGSRLPLRTLLDELPGAGVTGLLPAMWVQRLVWVRIQGPVRLDAGISGRRYLRVDVERLWVGQRRLPAVLVRLLFSPVALRLLRWPLPETVESVSVRPAHLVIQIAP